MTGGIAAPITVPIVTAILLVTWLTLVYHAARHPHWRGRRPTAQQWPGAGSVRRLFGQAALPPAAPQRPPQLIPTYQRQEGARPEPAAGAARPAPRRRRTHVFVPSQGAALRPVVPRQRQPVSADRQLAGAGSGRHHHWWQHSG